MVMPNNLQRFMYDAFVIIKDNIPILDEICSINGSIITSDYLVWCYNKHGKYDRFKNNVERILRINKMRSFGIFQDNVFRVLFGILNYHEVEDLIFEIDTIYCDDCINKYIVVNLNRFIVNVTCIHSLEQIIS